MTDLLTPPDPHREPMLESYSDISNPIGLNGIEFIEYTSNRPQVLGHVLEMIGFRPIARHRSREVMLYRQGEMNIVVNAHNRQADNESTTIAAIALRVRNARAAYQYVLDRGAWAVNTQPEVMELNIPAIHGVGGSRLYLVDRYQEFSIYDVDFIPIIGVDQQPPAIADMHYFGIVQYIGNQRSDDWITFYQELFGAHAIAQDQRFGIMPQGSLIRFPAQSPEHSFLLQLVEPDAKAKNRNERFQRIGIGVPDVLAAVKQLRSRQVEFVETPSTHTETRGALTKTYEHGLVFELVHSPRQA